MRLKPVVPIESRVGLCALQKRKVSYSWQELNHSSLVAQRFTQSQYQLH